MQTLLQLHFSNLKCYLTFNKFPLLSEPTIRHNSISFLNNSTLPSERKKQKRQLKKPTTPELLVPIVKQERTTKTSSITTQQTKTKTVHYTIEACQLTAARRTLTRTQPTGAQ